MADEKFDEKEREKSEEKWHRDPLSAIIWALIFIWAGLVLLASNLGYLNQLINRAVTITGIEQIDKAISAWPIILVGAGVLMLFEVLIRLLIPEYRRPVTGTIIFAFILIAVGLNSMIGFSWNIIWPLILIAIGLSILFRGLGRKRE